MRSDWHHDLLIQVRPLAGLPLNDEHEARG